MDSKVQSEFSKTSKCCYLLSVTRTSAYKPALFKMLFCCCCCLSSFLGFHRKFSKNVSEELSFMNVKDKCERLFSSSTLKMFSCCFFLNLKFCNASFK